MATLREIRTKLRSVENIKKITQAMEMVAASRLFRSQQKTESSRPYFHELQRIFYQLLSEPHDFTHPCIQTRPKETVGLVIIAGDRGLCGSYNNNVFTAAEKFLSHYPREKVELILVGHKTVNYFSRKKWKIRHRVVDWGGKMSFERVQILTNDIIHSYLSEGLDEIWMTYTYFQNIMTQKVITEKFLNIEVTQQETNQIYLNYIFEPSERKVFIEILMRYCASKVQLVLNESFTSESAARIIAMRSATKNAEELIDELTLLRNKVRQASITRELIEITSGAESLKSLY